MIKNDFQNALKNMPNPFDGNQSETCGEFREKALKWMGDYYFSTLFLKTKDK